MKKIAVKRLDGGVTIIIPAKGTTEETMIRDAKNTVDYVSHRFIEDEQLPNDRYFRNAWTDNNSKTSTIDVDILKAKEVKKDYFRQARASKFEKLDLAANKAIQTGDTESLERIAKEKQELRDVTELDLPDDLQQLKEFTPEILKYI